MRTLLLTAAITVLASGAASALDLPVSYNVDARAMKRAAVAGNTLTFEVYEDSDCTSLIHSESIDVAAVQILLEELKTMRVKGGPKQAKIARLNVTLLGVTPGSASFLRVSGEGIVAGEVCKAQNAGIPGMPGPEGPEGPTGPQGEQGPAGPDFTSCSRVAAQLVHPSGPLTATLVVDCPSDQTALDGGRLGDSLGGGLLHAEPTSDLAGWFFRSREQNTTHDLYVVCCGS